MNEPERCRVCGSSYDDFTGIAERIGEPVCWQDAELCSACATEVFWAGWIAYEHGLHKHHNPYRQQLETRVYADEWDAGWLYASELQTEKTEES